jgi:hypothetical protein
MSDGLRCVRSSVEGPPSENERRLPAHRCSGRRAVPRGCARGAHAARLAGLWSGVGQVVESSDKAEDPRYGWFTDMYGEMCWELDALNPSVLRERVRGAVMAELDLVEWERYVAAAHVLAIVVTAPRKTPVRHRGNGLKREQSRTLDTAAQVVADAEKQRHYRRLRGSPRATPTFGTTPMPFGSARLTSSEGHTLERAAEPGRETPDRPSLRRRS